MHIRSMGLLLGAGILGAAIVAACDTTEIQPPAVDAGSVDATGTIDAAADTGAATDAAPTDGSVAQDSSADAAADAAPDGSLTCTINSTARPNALSLATSGSTGAGSMTLESAGCGAQTSVPYAADARGSVPAPSNVDFFVKIDPTDTAKWYPGTTQVFNFFSAGIGDDQEAYLAPKAGTFGSVTVNDVFPGFDANKAHVFMRITASPALGAPCNAADGIVISVPGHAEAVVRYLLLSNNTLSVSTGATATVVGGSTGLTFVAIEGITPGAPVEISGTKAGCGINAKIRPANDTGKVPLAAGRVAAISFLATKP